MKIVIFVMMTFAQSALCAELLTPNHLFYTSEQSDEFAFESSDKNGILQNPLPNKARIYGIRSKDYLGKKAVYKVFYQYEPKMELNIKGQNEPIIELNAYENNVFGTFANASKFYKDFDAGKPLLLFAQTETQAYIIFTPRPNRIYCVQSSVILGLHKASCERIYKEID